MIKILVLPDRAVLHVRAVKILAMDQRKRNQRYNSSNVCILSVYLDACVKFSFKSHATFMRRKKEKKITDIKWH